MMRPLKNIVIIQANPEKHFYKSLGKDPMGKEIIIWIDPIFNPHSSELVCQDGIVVETPLKIDKELGEMQLKTGDHVWTHHFLVDKDQLIDQVGEKKHFHLLYEQIYAVQEDNTFKMLWKWNFFEPYMETDDRPFVPDHLKSKRSSKIAIARYLSKQMQTQIKPGEKVIFRKNMDYLMKVNGQDFYRIHDDDLFAVLEETG